MGPKPSVPKRNGRSASLVARKYGISPSLLFCWRKLMTEGSEEAIRDGG